MIADSKAVVSAYMPGPLALWRGWSWWRQSSETLLCQLTLFAQNWGLCWQSHCTFAFFELFIAPEAYLWGDCDFLFPSGRIAVVVPLLIHLCKVSQLWPTIKDTWWDFSKISHLEKSPPTFLISNYSQPMIADWRAVVSAYMPGPLALWWGWSWWHQSSETLLCPVNLYLLRYI